jgi:hypothetical protein
MPTFSEVTITFTNDWEENDEIFLTIDSSTDSWRWVNTRSSGFEVTEGTPTATAGETTAINFKTAIDLDYPTGYVVTVQNDNEVLIQSETEGEDFDALELGNNNVGTYSVVFNNYVETPTAEAVDLMFVRSPYYVNTPFDFSTTTSVTVSVYIWDGAISSPPASPTLTLTKTRPSIDFSEFNVDVAKATRDYLTITPVYDLSLDSQIVPSESTAVKWVRYVASYTDPSQTIADIENTLVGCDGYGYYLQGANPTRPTNRILTDVLVRNVERTSFITLPFINDGTITSFDVVSNEGNINDNLPVSTTDQSDEYIQYIMVDTSQTVDDSYVTITVNPSGDEYVFEILQECRYTPTHVIFKNKYGVFDSIHMFKKRIDKMQTDRKQFVNNYISSGTYNTTIHQIKDLNITAKETVSLNSGYIPETENEIYKQLLLSDAVYFYEDSQYVPVRVTKNDLEFKTRTNDTVINYNIDFEYAFNTINNV